MGKQSSELGGYPGCVFSLREAGPADSQSIDEITVEAWQTCFRGAVSDDLLDAQQAGQRGAYFRTHLPSEPPYLTVVAVDDDDVIGYVHVGPCRDEDSACRAEIWGLYVSPRRHRKGVGTALMRRAMGWIRSGGLSEATLWTLRDVPATRRFYEAVGGEWDLGEKSEHVRGHDLRQVRYRFRVS